MNCGWERGKTAFITGKIHNSKEGCCRAHLWLPARGGWDQTLNWAIQQTSQQNKKPPALILFWKLSLGFRNCTLSKQYTGSIKFFWVSLLITILKTLEASCTRQGWHKYLISPSPPEAEIVGSLQIQCYPGLASSSRTVRATQWGKNINFKRFCLKPFWNLGNIWHLHRTPWLIQFSVLLIIIQSFNCTVGQSLITWTHTHTHTKWYKLQTSIYRKEYKFSLFLLLLKQSLIV